MKTYENFSTSSLGSEEEKTYLKVLFESHYSKKYKEKYADILEQKYKITREENIVRSTKSSNIRNITKYFLGAAACILVFFLAWPSINDTNNNLANLTNEHSSNDFLRNREVKRGSNMNDEYRVAAIQLYNNKKYKESLESYGSVGDLSSKDKFWIAMATFYDKDYISSEKLYNELSLVTNFKYLNEVKWYYALSLLQNGKKEEAKLVLSELNSWKKDEVEQLLKVLK